MSKYKLRTNDTEIELSADDLQEFDIIGLGGDAYHLLYEGKGYNAQVEQVDMEAKTVRVTVNGSAYNFNIEDRLDTLLAEMGYATKSDQRFSELRSPMPGLILEVLVEEGSEVEEGQPMLILEAMKMENILKAPGSGTVRKICLEKGDPVDKNQIIVEMV